MFWRTSQLLQQDMVQGGACSKQEWAARSQSAMDTLKSCPNKDPKWPAGCPEQAAQPSMAACTRQGPQAACLTAQHAAVCSVLQQGSKSSHTAGLFLNMRELTNPYKDLCHGLKQLGKCLTIDSMCRKCRKLMSHSRRPARRKAATW